MTKFIALCAPGLEKFVAKELGQVSEVKIHDGMIMFEFSGKTEKLLEVKTADEILFLVKKLAGISRYKSSLTNIKHQIAKSNFTKFGPINSFSVKASYTGKIDYTAKDIIKVVKQGISKKYHWKCYEESKTLIHVIIRKKIALIGLSHNNNKIRLKKVPGSLKSSITHTLLKLADVSEGDVLLDPMCGAGTIPIKAALTGATCIGGDIGSLDIAKENSELMDTNVEFHYWDASDTNVPDNSVDKIVCNLPFGKQVKLPDGFFEKFIDEMIRVSKKESRWVFLTMQGDIIKKKAAEHGIKIIDCINIINSGLKCEILILDT